MSANSSGGPAEATIAPRVTVRVEGDDWLFGARDAWTTLLARSDANPLFMSWPWQHLWWRHFGDELQGSAAILTAHDEHDRLVAIAPFFRRNTSFRGVARVRQLAPIGNVWRMNIGEVTEHTDWIIARGWEAIASDAFCQSIGEQMDWDELLFSYTEIQSLANSRLTALAAARNWYVRREKPLAHYAVDTSKPFATFVETLGKNTRLRIIGRRGALERFGEVAVVYADEANLSSQLGKLEQLTAKRWGSGFSEDTRRFYHDLAMHFIREGQLKLSTLEVNGVPISALFDVDVSSTIYNIRSAIDARFDRRLSPGLLHLGYAIEHACQNRVNRYSLLAGEGKHTDYKRNIANVGGQFSSLQIVRRAPERYLYRLNDRLRRLFRSPAS